MSGSGIYEDEFEGSDRDLLYADSPSDGYFTQRDFPTETFVEQSSVQAESEAKAREAAESQSASSAATPPSRTSPGSSIRSPVWVDEGTQLLDAGPAPPDYAAATAGRIRETTSESHGQGAETTAGEPSFPPTNYGTIDRGRPGGDMLNQSVEREWPLGQRNNPFGPNFPFGPSGSPFGPSGSPFGPSGSPFGASGSPFGPSGGPFGAAGQPQSMRDSREGDREEEHSLFGRRQQTRRWKQRAGGWCKPVRLINVLLGFAVIGLVVLLATITRGASRIDTPAPREGDDGSITPNTTEPQLGPEHPRNELCPFKWFSEATPFGFKHTDNFSLTEAMEPELYMKGGVSGSIWISAAPPEQEDDVVVVVSYASTEMWSVSNMDYVYAPGVFELRFPKTEKPRSTPVPNPCMDVAIGLYLKAHVTLDALNITAKNLDIQTGQGPSDFADYFAVSKTWAISTASFESHHGSVKMAYWSTRETRIETDSGHISGTYGLEDLLYLRTHSGQIEINIAPQPADKTHPAPAVFDAQSHSGGIHVGVTSYSDIVERDYRTSIETYSSSIQGTYIFSSAASFTTKSGSIEIDLLPYLDDDMLRRNPSISSTLRTDSGSGHTELSLQPPVKHTAAIIKHLYSSHYSASGSLDLVYPQAWEGTIEGMTRSGGIELRGKDIKVYYEGDTGAGGRRVVARKGHGESKLGFQSQSGSVKVRVGDM